MREPPVATEWTRWALLDRGARGACVLDGDYDNALALVEDHIDQQQPAPWAEQEPKAGPTSAELGAHLRELG